MYSSNICEILLYSRQVVVKMYEMIYIVQAAPVWETKFLEHTPEKQMSLISYVLYIIPLAQANFLLTQLKMHLHWRAGEH